MAQKQYLLHLHIESEGSDNPYRVAESLTNREDAEHVAQSAFDRARKAEGTVRFAGSVQPYEVIEKEWYGRTVRIFAKTGGPVWAESFDNNRLNMQGNENLPEVENTTPVKEAQAAPSGNLPAGTKKAAANTSKAGPVKPDNKPAPRKRGSF